MIELCWRGAGGFEAAASAATSIVASIRTLATDKI